MPDRTDYRCILDTDERHFEGFGRIAGSKKFVWEDYNVGDRRQSIKVYLPNRTALVLRPG